MSESQGWFRQHASAVLTFVLVIVSLGMFGLGTAWGEASDATIKSVGIMLTQLSGTILAALLAIMFFSLDDVKKQLATTAARLLASGEIIGNLSSAAQDALEKQLILNAVAPRVVDIDPSLLRLLNRTRAAILSSFHLHGFYQELTMNPYASDPRLVIRHHVRHFRVSAYHLKPPAENFPFSYNLEVGLPGDLELTTQDVLQSFEVRAGEKVLTRQDVEVKHDVSGTTPVVLIHCSADLPIDKELDVYLTVTTLGSVTDNTELFISRYPIHDFKWIFRYREDLLYDCAWFKKWPSKDGYLAGRGNHHGLTAGIMAFTSDWVLPGEGVACSWYPLHKKILAPGIAPVEGTEQPAMSQNALPG